MIPQAAVEAIHGAICDESLEDHLDPEWPGRCVKALEAATPYMRQAFILEMNARAVEEELGRPLFQKGARWPLPSFS